MSKVLERNTERCGRHLVVHYPTPERASYTCRSVRTRRLCQEINGRFVEPLIAQAVLDALSQRELELAVGALARTLEREWNEALVEVEYLEKKHESVKSRPPFELTPQQRRKILALANDIPQLWSSPTTKNSQRNSSHAFSSMM